MSVVIAAATDTELTNENFTATVSSPIVSVTVTGSLFPFVSGTVDGIEYKSLIDELVYQLNQNTTDTWTGGYTFNTNTFFISESSGGFNDITFSSDLQRALGFPTGSSDTNVTTKSDLDPYYIWISQESGRSNESGMYEEEIPKSQFELDDGAIFTLSPQDSSTFEVAVKSNYSRFDWQHLYEPRWKIYSFASSSQTPYTWEEHVKHVRSFFPFVVFLSNTASNATYEDRESTNRLRGEEARLDATPSFEQSYALYDINVKTWLRSRGTDFNFAQEVLAGA